MQVILLQKTGKLGRKYDIINVKDGYARNYLIPQNLATPATKSALSKIAKLKEKEIMKKEEVQANVSEIQEKIDGKIFTISEKISEAGHLYGSIGEKEIVELISKEAKTELDKKSIQLKNHIKELGEYDIDVKLTPEVTATFKLKIEELK